MAVAHNKPDSILVEKATQKWTIIDIAAPSDFNVVRTENWKVEKYQDLALVETTILTVVIGAQGTVPKWLSRTIELLGIGDSIANKQHC